MDDNDLIQRFIKIEPEVRGVNVFVCRISWKEPHTPTSTWELATQLKADVSSTEIEAQIHKVLNNEKYFQICRECKERNPCGWMHSRSMCQRCAERNHGIVY